MNQKVVIRSQTGKPSDKTEKLSQVLTVPVQASLQEQFIKTCPFFTVPLLHVFSRMLISSEKNPPPPQFLLRHGPRVNKKYYNDKNFYIVFPGRHPI